MARTENSIRNAVYGVLCQLITLILGLVNRALFVSVLGIEYLGISGLFTNIISVLSLADMGFATAMAYCLYKPIADNDTQQVIKTLAFFRRLYLAIAGLILIVGILAIPVLPALIKLDSAIEPKLPSGFATYGTAR